MVRSTFFRDSVLAILLLSVSSWVTSERDSFAREPISASNGLPLQIQEAQPIALDAIRPQVVEHARPEVVEHALSIDEHTNGCECRACRTTDWSKVPGICPMPRPGNFAIPPSGPGYYSMADWISGNRRERPPRSGYPPFALMPPSFFDADFRYVDALDPSERTLVERLKRMQVHDRLMFSTGGQFWLRYMHETNSRLHPQYITNDYTLGRVRAFGDLMYGDSVRLFGEYLWADAFDFAPHPAPPGFTPLPIDVDRGDILNLFVDLKIWDGDGHPVYVRGGRQELLLGSQRLISTLDWANTRRTFQGVRAFRRGEQWDADIFWVQPVIPDATSFDQADSEQNFAGAWLTHRAQKGRFLDLYYLYYGSGNTVTQFDIPRAPFDVHTLGSRWTGDKDGYLWDAELAMQFGERASSDVMAGMATAGVGRHFKNVWATPTAWLYYDYASGDSDPNSGTAHTFNQLFPFGHYYLGWIDLVGRQNIHDLNAHIYFYPAPWVTMFVQYHRFWLNQSTDALYNAGGVAIRRDATGAAGTDVGHEIDFVANFHLARYTDVLIGYSKLFGGRFLEATPGPSDSELFHLMFQQKW
jgi:hypothetical protein